MIRSSWFYGFVSLACLAAACKKPGGGPEENGTFTIHNLGVKFGSYNAGTGRAGDFIFQASQNKVFLEFGAVVGDGQGGIKELPTFEYRLDKDAWITAIASGTVTRFVYQSETQDYEFSVRSDEDPDWTVGYDHVKNPRVGMGDRVMPGDTLGNPGTWSATLVRFEIMINNYATGLSYCPFCCFLPESTLVYQNRVRLLVDQWEAFKGDTTIYDDHLWPWPGCRMESMVTY
ncbi:MAG TPA: hypothetical protein ENN03_10570 [bacterium]|nr:hypothetical protein [bacterium]